MRAEPCRPPMESPLKADCRADEHGSYDPENNNQRLVAHRGMLFTFSQPPSTFTISLISPRERLQSRIFFDRYDKPALIGAR